MARDPLASLDEALAASLLPSRDRRGHKGTFGRLVLVAGTLDYAGAALMAGAAALRAGCGLVSLAVPASLQPVVAGRIPELITAGLPEGDPGEVEPAAAAAALDALAADALLVGPGLRPTPPTTALVERLLADGTSPAVADAGALGALATLPRWWTRVRRPLVLTPHPGELRRLGHATGDEAEERRRVALEAAATWGQVVVLKGAGTVIAEPGGQALTAPFELPALATGGTGDVLAGVIGSLLAQGLAPFDAAALGVFLHGRAGALVSERLGDAGLMATDLLPQLPQVRRHLAHVRERARAPRLGFGSPGPAAGPAASAGEPPSDSEPSRGSSGG